MAAPSTARCWKRLIKSGACDCFGETRATLFSNIDRVLARAAGIIHDRQRGQDTLFGMLEERAEDKPEPEKQLPEWPQHELLAHEKELLGFYVTGHPLTPFAPILEKYAVTPPANWPPGQSHHDPHRRPGDEAQKGISKKERQTLRHGHAGRFGRLRPSALPERELRKIHQPRSPRTPPCSSPAKSIVPRTSPKFSRRKSSLWKTRPTSTPNKSICACKRPILSPADLEAVRDLGARHPGKCPLFLCLKWPGGEVVFIEAHEVSPSTLAGLQQAVDEKFGEDTYYAKVDALPERAPRQWEKRGQANGEPE